MQAFMLHLIASLVLPGLTIHVSGLILEHDHVASISKTGGAVSLLRGGASTAVEEFAVAEADSEMGSDLGLDLSLEQDSARVTGEPATLAAYCAGPPKGAGALKEGERVTANWKGDGLDVEYPAKISDINEDGTVDVKYDDGFKEKEVDPDKVHEKKKGAAAFSQFALAKPRDDPACELQDFLGKVQTGVKDLNGKITEWVGGQRAKIASSDAPAAPPKVAAAAPPPSVMQGDASTAAPTGDQTDKLEKLKAELSGLDTYIAELEGDKAKLDKELEAKQNPAGAPSAAPPGPPTVDDLIAQYEAKIAQRNVRVKELQQDIKERKEKLAQLAAGPLTLKDINADLTKLEQAVEEGKKKRDELEKAGKIDPELGAMIDNIIKSITKARKKVDNLLALEAKAEAEKTQAAQEAEAAAAAARQKAKEEGKDADEAASEAIDAANKKSDEASRKADLATMEAAGEVAKELKDTEKGTTKMDTGLHPHGEKWWRYRYEHSYIESVLMIFVSFLMLAWSQIWHKLKHHINVWAQPPGETNYHYDDDPFPALHEETHGAVYVLWLHWFADQMLVCIFVFLTLWLITKTGAVAIFPVFITASPDMHVPHGEHAAQEYRTIAIDICTIFFFSVVFYFLLMFSVAKAITTTTASIEELEQESAAHKQRHNVKMSKLDAAGKLEKAAKHEQKQHSLALRVSESSMGSICDTREHYDLLMQNFTTVMTHQTELFDDDQDRQELSRMLGGDYSTFPLAKYLKMKIAANGVELLKFGFSMWLPVIALFLCLMLLHRYAHMGYIRIMGASSLGVMLLIIFMAYYTKNKIRGLTTPKTDEELKNLHEHKSFDQKFDAEAIVLNLLQFSLFFVCYGVARMICQPWMWELHFWPVFILTIVALLSAVIFVFIVSPGIPSFIAAMALPPYIGDDDMAMMKFVAQSSQKPSDPLNSPRPASARLYSESTF